MRDKDPSDNMEDTNIDGVSNDAELTNVDDNMIEPMMILGNGYKCMIAEDKSIVLNE